MADPSGEHSALAHLLPEEHVGKVTAVRPLSPGFSGVGVHAVSSTRGELVLRVSPDTGDPAPWRQQLRVLRRAAERGIAPAVVHVDEAARAVVSARVPGVALPAALMDPAERPPALASVVSQLRALHAIDATDVGEGDPVVQGLSLLTAQRKRAGFPVWAGSLEPLFGEIGAALRRDPRRVVSHNDLNPGNVVWDGTRAWLVDWEVAGLAHPFYDLATLAMFIRLDDATALGLLEQQERRALSGDERATFSALRRLAAMLCGLVLASTIPDLGVLPSSPPTLADFYAQLRAGAVDLVHASGRGAFALALLQASTTAP